MVGNARQICGNRRQSVRWIAGLQLQSVEDGCKRRAMEQDMSKDILVIGAGKIGSMVAELLADSGSYQVTLADRLPPPFPLAPVIPGLRCRQLDVGDTTMLQRALKGCFAVISAVPYGCTEAIAHEAVAEGVHYLDLTEDVAVTRTVRALAAQARSALVPQCGLAPGFVSIAAKALAARFDSLESLQLRTGALPQFPTNRLGYNLTWSTEGVINEYCQPCEAIVDGQPVTVPPLEECEAFWLDGVRYEAFNTSGGLGSLGDSLAGGLRQLSYRSIRYPGHADAMKLLLQDLGLRRNQALLRQILEQSLPATLQDLVIVFITATGYRRGRLLQENYLHKVYARGIRGEMRSAIQITTAAAICAVLDLLADGALPQQGLVRQEEIPLARFLDNRFGRLYGQPAPGQLDFGQPGPVQALPEVA
jgi:saccharopine dehydrogenase-like NADP-dependent oxidoreductase